MVRAQLKEDLKSPWLLGILGLVAAALTGTISMVVIASNNAPGLVVKNYYERGKEYFHNHPSRVADAEKLRMQLLVAKGLRQGEGKPLQLFAIQPDGKPLKEGAATLFAYRPDSDQHDFRTSMRLADAGTFQADVTFPLAGVWDLIAEVEYDGRRVSTAQRIFVRD